MVEQIVLKIRSLWKQGVFTAEVGGDRKQTGQISLTSAAATAAVKWNLLESC